MLLGCDFSSAPTKRKPIMLALGELHGERVILKGLKDLHSLADYAAWMAERRTWVGGFDFPFGLPRELVEHLGWPVEWRDCIAHYAGLERSAIRETFAAFCDARPAGGKFAHRATDRPAGSSPSMKWVNPPVAWMLHAGLPPLLAAGAHIPGLHDGDRSRVALEAYPGLLARELIGSRSYKSDARAKQTPGRLIARKDIVGALEAGRTRLALRLKLGNAQQEQLLDDPSGDSLDAVLCMVQAAWALRRHEQGAPRYGLPETVDPLEGWIVTA